MCTTEPHRIICLCCKVKYFTFSLCNLLCRNVWLHLFSISYDDCVSTFYSWVIYCVTAFLFLFLLSFLAGIHNCLFFFPFNFLWMLCLSTPSNISIKYLSIMFHMLKHWQFTSSFFYCCFFEPLPPCPSERCVHWAWGTAVTLGMLIASLLCFLNPCPLLSWLIPLFWWGIFCSGFLR